MPTMAPASAASGAATTAVSQHAPLLCSDNDPLLCSDDLDCSDNGAVISTTSTGTMVAA